MAISKVLPDQVAGLRVFYFICEYALVTSAIALVVDLCVTTATPQLVVIPVALVIALAVYLRRRRAERKITEDIERQDNEQTHGPRVAKKLGEWEKVLRAHCHDSSARLLFDPNPAVLLYTLRSDERPIVALTAGFYQQYKDDETSIETGLAHEAGHIVARDVEKLNRLRALMHALFIGGSAAVILTVAVQAIVARSVTSALGGGLFVISAFPFGALAAMIALLHARELQADAYAVSSLRDEKPVRDFLLRQLEGSSRAASTFRSRVRRWLIQPNLAWRTRLPFVKRDMGVAMPLLLGGAVGGSVQACIICVSALQMSGISHASSATASDNTLIAKSAFAWCWLFTVWSVYSFIWGRSSAFGGRSVGALLNVWSSIALFLAPLLLMTLGFDAFTLFNSQKVEADGPLRGVWYYVLLSCFLWATSRVTLLTRAERRRVEPSRMRAFIACAIVTGISTFAYVVAGGDSNHATTPEALFGPRFAIAPIVLGVMAHFIAPRSSSSERSDDASDEAVSLEAGLMSLGFSLAQTPDGFPTIRVSLTNNFSFAIAVDSVVLALVVSVDKPMGDASALAQVRNYSHSLTKIEISYGGLGRLMSVIPRVLLCRRDGNTSGVIHQSDTVVWEVAAEEMTLSLVRRLSFALTDGCKVEVELGSGQDVPKVVGSDAFRVHVEAWRERLAHEFFGAVDGGTEEAK